MIVNKHIYEISNRLLMIAYPEHQSCVLILWNIMKPKVFSFTFNELESEIKKIQNKRKK